MCQNLLRAVTSGERKKGWEGEGAWDQPLPTFRYAQVKGQVGQVSGLDSLTPEGLDILTPEPHSLLISWAEKLVLRGTLFISV